MPIMGHINPFHTLHLSQISFVIHPLMPRYYKFSSVEKKIIPKYDATVNNILTHNVSYFLNDAVSSS